MKSHFFYSLLVLLAISFSSNAQEIVRGEVTDSKSGDPVVDAIVYVNGKGTMRTDLDGAYSLNLAPGKYTLKFSQTLDGYLDEEREIELVAGQVLILDIKMSNSLTEVIGVEVVATAPPTSDKALDEERLEAEGTTDIVGSETMQQKGIVDAATAVSTTPGASVEDGKNVYIRGLGDRYTKTILNGMDIPGLDPDRNSVQLDIFPTVLVDKITIYKTFTPNLSADFTGGLIDIETKNFPTRKTIYAKAGLGYNNFATFNPEFISYEGGSLDFLGFDDGTRALNINPAAPIPNPVLGQQATAIATQSFSETMATEKSFAFMNQNYAAGIGDQKNFYTPYGSKVKDIKLNQLDRKLEQNEKTEEVLEKKIEEAKGDKKYVEKHDKLMAKLEKKLEKNTQVGKEIASSEAKEKLEKRIVQKYDKKIAKVNEQMKRAVKREAELKKEENSEKFKKKLKQNEEMQSTLKQKLKDLENEKNAPTKYDEKLTQNEEAGRQLQEKYEKFENAGPLAKFKNRLKENERIENLITSQSKKVEEMDSTRLTYGYNFVANYRSSNTYFADVEYNEFIKDPDRSETELFRDRTSRGEQTESNVLWTALLGQSIKFGKSKFALTFFHTQNGTSSAANLTEKNYDSNQAVLLKQGLQYTQRSVSNANLTGTHFLDIANKWKLVWKLSPTLSQISDPDIRSTAIELSDETIEGEDPIYLWEESAGADVRRIFRSLTEYNLSGRFDLERKFTVWRDSLSSTLSFGGLTTYKNRSFDTYEYVFRLYNMSNVVPNDPNWFFQDENVWSPESNQGTYAVGELERANIYEANQMINAAYVMNELPFNEAFSATYGARVERNVNRYTGQDNNAEFDPNAPKYDNEVVLNKINVLPSLNMVYKIKGEADEFRYERNTNFRLAYTQTVARPSFREISISQIYDPIQGRRYNGNIDLKQTLIHNADFRWERFFGRTEILSASAFYKRFINPIEIVANVAAPNEFTPVNAGVADMYGAEFEFRKAIGFNKKSQEHKRFVLGGNFTYVLSRIDMNKVETVVGGVTYTEKEVRQANARVGEVIGDYRTMYGQSPYIINAFANYNDDSLFLSCNISYNVQGKKLAVIGVGGLPDVFEQPFHSLSVKVSKGFGKVYEGESAPRWSASLTGRNLLNQARRRYYESFNADSEIFDYLNRGMSISAAVSYTIK